MKLKHVTLVLEIYGNYSLHIVISNKLCKARNKFKEELNSEVEESENVDGMHSYRDSDTMESYIFLTPDSSSGVIAHESFHATNRIMRIIGGKLSRKSEESYAYLLTYIVDTISSVYIELDKKKKKK